LRVCLFGGLVAANHRVGVLQCLAVCCRVLQSVTVCCSVLQSVANAQVTPALLLSLCVTGRDFCAQALCCSVLQRVAACCIGVVCFYSCAQGMTLVKYPNSALQSFHSTKCSSELTFEIPLPTFV
jgi:glycerol uptake facilitator-like aquaporin